jgi:hypothetical protein
MPEVAGARGDPAHSALGLLAAPARALSRSSRQALRNGSLLLLQAPASSLSRGSPRLGRFPLRGCVGGPQRRADHKLAYLWTRRPAHALPIATAMASTIAPPSVRPRIVSAASFQVNVSGSPRHSAPCRPGAGRPPGPRDQLPATAHALRRSSCPASDVRRASQSDPTVDIACLAGPS